MKVNIVVNVKCENLKKSCCSPVFSDHIDKFRYILINPSVFKVI